MLFQALFLLPENPVRALWVYSACAPSSKNHQFLSPFSCTGYLDWWLRFFFAPPWLLSHLDRIEKKRLHSSGMFDAEVVLNYPWSLAWRLLLCLTVASQQGKRLSSAHLPTSMPKLVLFIRNLELIQLPLTDTLPATSEFSLVSSSNKQNYKNAMSARWLESAATQSSALTLEELMLRRRQAILNDL